MRFSFKILFFLLLVFYFLLPYQVYAQQGCCSWHGGIAYCDYSSGRYVCNDDTYSPSCTCGAAQPICSLHSSFNSITGNCECNYGYVVSNGRCVSTDQLCQDKIGFNSRYNSLTDQCECSYGYLFDGSKCVSRNQYCWDNFGYGSEFDVVSETCECGLLYMLDASGSKCVLGETQCKYLYGYNAIYNTSNRSCECEQGYIFDQNNSNCISQDEYCQEILGINSIYDLSSESCVCVEDYVLKNNECVEDRRLLDVLNMQKDTRNKDILVKEANNTFNNLFNNVSESYGDLDNTDKIMSGGFFSLILLGFYSWLRNR